MKFLKPYNESIKDYLKPKSEEEIKKAILNLPPDKQLMTACEYGMWDFVKELIEEGIDINSDDYYNTPLTLASKQNDLEMVKYLISKGADINKTVKDKNTALTLSSLFGHLEMVKFLVENGADMFHKSNTIENALSIAARSLNYDIVEYLLEKMKNTKK